jgi:hypothetical protein
LYTEAAPGPTRTTVDIPAVPRAVDLEALCTSCDRTTHSQLLLFGQACVRDLSDAASSLLGVRFIEAQISDRNSGFAKKQTDRDLRCPMLWTVIDIWAARPSGIQGASNEFNIPRLSLLRYYNNCSAKHITLEAVAVANVERKILHHLGTILSSAKPTHVESIKAMAEQRITPLHL